MAKIVKQVDIKVLNAAALQLLFKNPVHILFAFQCEYWKLVGYLDFLSRISLYNAFPDCLFALSPMIIVTCIEIVISRINISINHPINPVQIDYSPVLFINKRQSHETET